MEARERKLCKLAVADDTFIERALSGESTNLAASGLDSKSHALVRVAALVALGASSPAYMSAIEAARGAGASDDEIVGVLVAVMPTIGVPAVVAAAPELGLALGFDVAEALEDIGAVPRS